jgi:hypothetical protein
MLRTRTYAQKALRHTNPASRASRDLSSAAGEASASKPRWWGVVSPERFKAGVLGKLEAGEGVMLRSTHASEAAFLRDVAAALQAVLESSLQSPAKITAALNTKSPASELPEDVASIRKVLRRLVGDRMLETIEADAKARSADEAADQSGRKVWLHSLSLAGVRSHAITRRPAAPDAASGGLLYNSQHNCIVESREGECSTLLTPWGIAMTNPGFIRPRIDALDNATAQRRSKPTDMAQAMEMAAKEAQAEEAGKRRAGVPLDAPPIPASLVPAAKVLVQARVVFGTLEMAGGKLLAPGEAGEGGALEQPEGWRARQWRQGWGAGRADADGWGLDKSGIPGVEAGGARSIALKTVRERLEEALKSDSARLAKGSRSARAVSNKTAGLGLGTTSGGELVDRAVARMAAAMAREASAKAAMAAATSAQDGSVDDSSSSDDSVVSGDNGGSRSGVRKTGLEAMEVGAFAAKHLSLSAGDPEEAARLEELVQDEVALQGVLAQYTHWHEATMEMVLTRPAPSWSRFMTPAEEEEQDDEDEEKDEDSEEENSETEKAAADAESGKIKSSHGSAAAERAESLRRDLKRGVLSDAPGRSGAGPAGSPVGLEAMLERLNWELRGFLGLCVRAVTRMTGGIILRGPDLVPEPGKWRVVGIDEGVPSGWWEGDRRAAAAWQTAEALASSRLVSENGDWTEVAEALASMPRPDVSREVTAASREEEEEEDAEEEEAAAVDSAIVAAREAERRWPAPPATVGNSAPEGIPSDLLLVMRTRTPLMRHWPPGALGVYPAASSVRAAVKDTASWQFEDEEDESDTGEATDQDHDAEAAVGTVSSEFGVTWHDGWANRDAAASSTIPTVTGTFGSRIGMGDGRWTAKSTAALDYDALGHIEAVSSSGEASKEKEDRASEGNAAAKAAAGVEFVQHAPPPPSWARSAMKQMAAIAQKARA